MNFTFLFSGALLALPLAGLPVVLHLLFRRKSPVVMFSTIRFIKASVQRTAARKRLQKWLLLACRMLLLALLIAAVAQPAKLLGGAWSSSKKSAIAAIVVDTSYSMQLQDHREALLHKADSAVRDLLQTQFANGKVALFKNSPSPGGAPQRLQSSAKMLSEWTDLTPQASQRPLSDRVASAVDLLDREHSDDKTLVVISDFQKREFPNQFAKPKNARVVLIDLHPDDPRSAGVTRVSLDPAQPTPGTGCEAVVDITGKPNSARPLSVSVNTAAGAALSQSGVQVANFNTSGHARLRFGLHLLVQPWLLPSEPLATSIAPVNTVAVSAEGDPLLSGFSRDKFNDIIVRRVVPFSADPQGRLLLNCFPKDPRPGMRPAGLLYRRAVGTGIVYTIATLPDRQYTNFQFHPLFLPLMVRMSQRPQSRSAAQNMELGQSIALSGAQYASFPEMTVQGPQNDMTVVKADRSGGSVRFVFGIAGTPGLYTWFKPASNEAVAMTNVQLPADESELVYTPAALTTDAGDNVVVVRSMAELNARVSHLAEPQPMWATPIAIVLLLLCAEALVASFSRLWKPVSLRVFVPGLSSGVG